jgi:hypothetical protein
MFKKKKIVMYGAEFIKRREEEEGKPAGLMHVKLQMSFKLNGVANQMACWWENRKTGE